MKNSEKFFRDVVKINREILAIEVYHRAMTAAYEGCKGETTKNASVEKKAQQGSRMDKKAAHKVGWLKALFSKIKNHKATYEDRMSKTIENARLVKELGSNMDYDVGQTLKRAKRLKDRLATLVKSNAGNSSDDDATLTSTVWVLEQNLNAKMKGFQKLREKINEGHKATIQSRYFIVTGEYPEEQTVDLLISTGDTETFFQKSIQQQGKEQISDTIAEIQEWLAVVSDVERNLKELDQIFHNTVLLAQHQGEQSDDIELRPKSMKLLAAVKQKQAGTSLPS